MSGALVDITTTRPKDWKYVAEGGASLVVRYVGPPSATLSSRVLRVRKRPIATSVKSTTLSEGIEQEILNFQADIVSSILPHGCIPILHPAIVDPTWLEELAARTELMRPLARREVDCIDVSRPYAIVAPNLIGEMGVTVEIKVSRTIIAILHA
jgi:inositol-pentakisphosphate 2-kinase